MNRGRDQVHSVESTPDNQLEAFQKLVADRFQNLAAPDSEELLSIPWIQKLLDAFIVCQDEFRLIICNNKPGLNRPPMEKYISDFFERSVKAMDLCNAIRDGIDQIRQWHKQLEIVLCALDNERSLGEGQFRRAKKALIDLAIGMLDEKEPNSSGGSHRNRSFGRSNREQRPLSQLRSLSWSVSRNWSAFKQLQAISNSLVPPKANEIASTNGLSLVVFTMNYVLLFVMWTLVAAIPCQDRGLQTHFYVTRQFDWGVHILLLHERILEVSKKKDRRNSCGLLNEIYGIEKCARHMNELTDSVKFPLTEENETEVKDRVGEVKEVYEAIKGGLDPLEKQVRQVFHSIVRSRTEGLDSIGTGESSGH